jgi:hypothetical protein
VTISENGPVSPVGLPNRLRRQGEMRLDQAWAVARKRFGRTPAVDAFDGDPRLALLTVNFSTTRYLKLMLLTLGEQEGLGLLNRVVVADNRSRDGGRLFLSSLSERVERLHLVENRVFLNHARGMRRALGELDRVEADHPAAERSNLLLYCDPDVIFRSPEALLDLAASVAGHDAAFAGELRRSRAPYPEAQASFFVVRRDVHARRDVRPWVYHGDPAHWMQQSIWEAGLTVVDFPSNHGGHILHRGRAGVAAAAEFSPRHSYAKVDRRAPHFMGVPGGAETWAAIEGRHERLLRVENEPELVDRLAAELERLGTGA